MIKKTFTKGFAPIVLAALTLAGCQTPTEVDKGPIRASTFSFFKPGPLPPGAMTENRQEIHSMIQQAITHRLGAQGVTRLASGGDVTVAYLVIVGNNATTSAINDYFGYTEAGAALADQAHAKYTEGEHRNYFEAGTLVIDIIDSHTQKLLRRNNVTRPVLRNPAPNVRQAHLQEAVDAALAGLRIEK